MNGEGFVSILVYSERAMGMGIAVLPLALAIDMLNERPGHDV
jgi:hypothetical protein